MKQLVGVVVLVGAVNAGAAELQITGTAKEAKFSSCLSTVTDLEQFFGDGNSYGNWSVWASENADKQPFNASVELTFNDGVQLVDFTVAPTPDGACTYTYTRTWFSSKSCLATSKEDFLKEFEYKTELNRDIGAFAKDGVKVFLMPAGSGCVVQKKEIGFRHKKQGT